MLQGTGVLDHQTVEVTQDDQGESPGVVRRQFDETVVIGVTLRRRRLSLPLGGPSWPIVLVYAMTDLTVIGGGRAVAALERSDCLVVRQATTLTVEAAGDGRLMIVLVPSCALALHRRMENVSDGAVVSTRTGTALLVRHLVEGLAAQLDVYEPDDPGRLAHHMIGLLSLMFTEPKNAADRSTLLEQSKQYIEEHLTDFDLAPGRVAEAQNLSLRTLHRLFEADGITIRGWIRQRRLENCRLDLTDPSFAQTPVSSVASRWGLWDAAHFSRIFKLAYGVSPTGYRFANKRRGSHTLQGHPSQIAGAA